MSRRMADKCDARCVLEIACLSSSKLGMTLRADFATQLKHLQSLWIISGQAVQHNKPPGETTRAYVRGKLAMGAGGVSG